MHELFFSKSSLSAPRNDEEFKRKSYLIRLNVENVGGYHIDNVTQAFSQMNFGGKVGTS